MPHVQLERETCPNHDIIVVWSSFQELANYGEPEHRYASGGSWPLFIMDIWIFIAEGDITIMLTLKFLENAPQIIRLQEGYSITSICKRFISLCYLVIARSRSQASVCVLPEKNRGLESLLEGELLFYLPASNLPLPDNFLSVSLYNILCKTLCRPSKSSWTESANKTHRTSHSRVLAGSQA